MRARYVMAMVALLGLAVGLVACNTVEGIGRDIRAAGQAITGTAERTKEEITD